MFDDPSYQQNKPSAIGKIASTLAGNIPVIGGVIQGVSDAIQSRRNNDRQNRANRELADYQYSKDTEMWNKGNLYNAPGAQMERLKAAGLNPNLVYGNGVTGNSASQLPKYQAPQVSYQGNKNPVNFPETIAMHQQLQMQAANIDNVKAQTKATEQKAANDAILNRILLIKEIGEPYRNEILSTRATEGEALRPHNVAIRKGEADRQQKILDKLTGEIGLQKWMADNFNSQIKTRTTQRGLMRQQENESWYRTNYTDLKSKFQETLNKLGQKGIFQGDNPLLRVPLQNWQEIKDFIYHEVLGNKD